MTTITAAYTTTPRMFMHMYRSAARWVYATRILLAGVLVIGGLIGGSPVYVVTGVLAFAVSEFVLRHRLRAYLGGDRSWTVTMTEEDVRIEGLDITASRAWSTFRDVRRRSGVWVLSVSHMRAMSFPVAALDAQQTEEFEALLVRKGLGPR